MSARRIVWFCVSAVAIASWFAAASTSGVRAPAVPPPPPAAAIERSVDVLQTQVSRLHDRIGPTTIPSHARDLFRYSAPVPRRAPGEGSPRAAARAVVDTAPVAPPPALKLIGIAEDATPDGIVRTAIVSGLGGVFLVKAGDTVAGQFRVAQVSADAVQLTGIAGGTSTTLALR